MKIPNNLISIDNITVRGDESKQTIIVTISPELKEATKEKQKFLKDDLSAYLSKWEGKVLNQSTYDAIQNDVLNYYKRLNESNFFGC